MSRLGFVAALLAGVALLGEGCARPVPPPVPEGEDYVFPRPAPGELSPRETTELEKAWRHVLSGEADKAARGYRAVLARRPGLVPAEAGLAYARLREGRAAEASALFKSALDRRPEYLPALVGAGASARRTGQLEAALALYRHAQSAAPDDALVRKRVAELKLRITDRRMSGASAALDRGDTDAAAAEYRAALDAAPEVAGVRLALADLLLGRGESDEAVEVLEGDPSGDRGVGLRLGAVLSGRQEYGRAAEVYARLLEHDPSDVEARAGERSARESLALMAMPEEYRAIAGATRIDRADLAALLAARVTALRRCGPAEPRVVVDTQASWAREPIASVVGLGIMDPYPNHTFQPGATVRRVDVARAAARVLDRLGWPQAPAPPPSDMSRSHLDYDAVSRTLGAGLMALDEAGRFEPWRPVSGEEAIEVLESLSRLVGP
jgi:tetratricopeptide (TPR) repeat protein